MSKIKNTGFYERLLAEISEQIGDSFPNKFNQNEQGEFILGYYQQRGFFRKPKYDNNVDNDNTNITITE